MKKLGRREFIKITGAGAGAVYFGGCASWMAQSSRADDGREPQSNRSAEPSPTHRNFTKFDDFNLALGPVDRTLGDVAPARFSGDQPEGPHRILWNKKAFIAGLPHGLPAPSEEVKVCVVGAGVGGISSAYLLKDQKPLLLEQATRFGGNSKGESWRGLDYAIGASYFTLPKEGSPTYQLFKELGIENQLSSSTEGDPIYISRKRIDGYWENGTTPGNKKQFRKIQAYLLSVANETNGEIYPEIPAETPQARKRVNELDQISFADQLEKVAGEPLHPHLFKIIDNYCGSAFAAAATEVSAAAGLNFYAGDFQGITVAPGGNAGIAEAMLKVLHQNVGPDALRASSLVFDVRLAGEGVNTSYLTAAGEVKTIHSKYAVLACPKFVVAKLIDDLEKARLDAIHSLHYRAYLVANVLINRGLPKSFFDIEFFEEGAPRKTTGVTDITYGNYSQPDAARTVITLYRCLPYEGGRSEVYQPDAYETFKKEFETQIQKEVLPILGLSQKDVVDLRITRWGHPLPVPSVGNIASGKIDLIRKPFKNRVFFVEQDNWALPAFESSYAEALHWTQQMRKLGF